MNWLAYGSWAIGPLLQTTLLVFMVRNKFHTSFPRFFSYILFQTLKSALLFFAYRYFNDHYFEAYWTGNAVSVIFAVAVMDEILCSLFEEYGGIQTLGMTIFRWSCGLLLLVAIIGALSSSEADGDRVAAAVFAFDRSMRLMQIGLFLLLMLLCRLLKNCWRQPVFGIALGFGLFASVELILVSVVMWSGSSHGALISLSKSLAYNAVTLVWIGYLRQQPHLVPRVESTMNANIFGVALAAPGLAPAPEASFMMRVEHAVDRALSRHEWGASNSEEKPTADRKPRPKDAH